MKRLKKQITYFRERATVACDGRCDKAWGRQVRPHVDPDDFESDFAADADLETAPEDPETYEGGVAKPTQLEDRMNKWCTRQCERCWISPVGQPGAPVELPTF